MAINKSFENIKEINQKAQAETSVKHCLLLLFDIGELLHNNPDLTEAIKILNKQKITAYQSVQQSEEEILKKLDKIYAKVKPYKIKKKLFVPAISDYEGFGNSDPSKRIDSTWDVITEKKLALEGEIWWLAQDSEGHIAFVTKCTQAMQGIEKKFNNWRQLSDQLLLDQETTTWYHYDRVIALYQLLKNGPHVHAALIAEGNFFDATSTSSAHNSLNLALTGKNNGCSSTFDLHELKYSLYKVIRHIEDSLSNYTATIEKPEITKKTASNPTYDGTTKILTIDDQEIPFQPEMGPEKILELGFPAGSPSLKGIPISVVYDEALKESEADPDFCELDKYERKKINKKIRDICSYLNKHIARILKKNIWIVKIKGSTLFFGYNPQPSFEI